MFQRCEVPLVWWPWWPFNAADVYMGSLLPLERMLREGVIDDRVTLVPVLDGFRLPSFYNWWFGAFFKRRVRLLPQDKDPALHLQIHAGDDVTDIHCSLECGQSRDVHFSCLQRVSCSSYMAICQCSLRPKYRAIQQPPK